VVALPWAYRQQAGKYVPSVFSVYLYHASSKTCLSTSTAILLAQTAPLRIAIFASGKGSNAQQLLAHFASTGVAEVALLVSNKQSSGVFDLGRRHRVPTVWLVQQQHADGPTLLQLLQRYHIDLVVLAGYLKLIPAEVVTAYPRRILNIHPSLLPAHGGQGMYGARVHQAVLDQGDAHSGITIHYVDEVYDRGEVIFQERLPVQAGWTAAQLQKAIHQLEHIHFPVVVEKVCRELRSQHDKS
jgi:phosphoribosylglycinamide formyltransferase-1